MLAAFVLGMTLTLIGIVIRLLTAVRHRRVWDIVYWSIMVVWTGWILWVSLRREETLFTILLPGLLPWAEATLVTLFSWSRSPTSSAVSSKPGTGARRKQRTTHADGRAREEG
ncbi:hypothetical protein OO015_11435 [Thermomicrobium sp. 4228-Ro]|uniref:hypothetical protein n=1 Tax=Thermomicrobium sp. 4228-Ro TaxID=2993937 RepID=UPI0022494A29|nr:hypothetical protein [Thermomicrobium sp. 4228-Ro]MCX2728102.1 hypothetical protein [Thermomicrobium sp. 4228-Ro]